MRLSTLITRALGAILLYIPTSLAAEGRLAKLQTPHSTPTTYGILLFPAFEMLDIYGPLEALSLLALRTHLNLHVIAETLDPVSPAPKPSANRFNSSFYPPMIPTHTFATAPDLDVLLVPGGVGTAYYGESLNRTIAYIAAAYPKVQYLLTVCTGSALASRAGILDGRRATTNKASWRDVTANQAGINNTVDWVPKARWVVDGNVWTSSGISAGIDATLAFIEAVYGRENATWVSNIMEFERNEDAEHDPFAEIWDVPGWDA
ncbi:class I glutamine amidotransferase-like protein [Aspergillus karnatakaensis]|uniref:DJ-1/PfpI family protein n=1 Tax=Aspergillus karnatakaensis TaxID=1810916 RepID=UPI003CCE4199